MQAWNIIEYVEVIHALLKPGGQCAVAWAKNAHVVGVRVGEWCAGVTDGSWCWISAQGNARMVAGFLDRIPTPTHRPLGTHLPIHLCKRNPCIYIPTRTQYACTQAYGHPSGR